MCPVLDDADEHEVHVLSVGHHIHPSNEESNNREIIACRIVKSVVKILLLRQSGFMMKYVTICRLTPVMLRLSGTLFHNIHILMP